MIAAVLLVLALATGSNAYANGNKDNSIGTTINYRQPNDSVSREETIQTHMPEPSPKCWRSATAILDHGVQHGSLDAQDMCALLPEQQQKGLALEIARCHLGDLGKPLMKDQASEEKCSPADYSSIDLHFCLRNLSDPGANAYTHYVSYVQQFCIRLTQELLMYQQQETQNELSAQYADISGRSIEHMKAVQDLTDQLQTLSEIPKQVMESLTSELQEEVRNTLQQSLTDELKEQLHGQFSSLLREQAVEQTAFVANIMEHIQARDEDHRERYEMWSHFQSTMWQQHAQDMDQQREKMQNLSESISKTSQTMQPFLVLEFMMKTVSEGYTWLTLMVHFAVMFTLVWLFTRPTRCHRFRVYLYLLVLAEAAAELVLLGLHQKSLIGEEERHLFTNELRRWAPVLHCVIYVVCFCFTFIAPKRESSTHSPVDLQTHNRAMEELRETQLQVLQRMEANHSTESHRAMEELRETQLQVLQRMEALKAMSTQQQSMNHRVFAGAQQSNGMIREARFRSPPPLMQNRQEPPTRTLHSGYFLQSENQTSHPVYHPHFPANQNAMAISNQHVGDHHSDSAPRNEYTQDYRVVSSSTTDPRLEAEHGYMVPTYAAVSPANTSHPPNVTPMLSLHQNALPTSLSASLDRPNHSLSTTNNSATGSLPAEQGADGAPTDMDHSTETSLDVNQPVGNEDDQPSSRKHAATEIIDTERPRKKARCDTEETA